jgi:hypothetical protein
MIGSGLGVRLPVPDWPALALPAELATTITTKARRTARVLNVRMMNLMPFKASRADSGDAVQTADP